MKTNTTLELVEMLFTVTRRMKDEMSFTNNLIHLSILQIQTLIFLNQNKNKKISMGNIAEYFRIELPSATSLLNKLCEQKLVERHTDQEDRRLVIITLTSEGKTLLEQAVCQRRKKLEKVLSYLSEQEKSELSHILETINVKIAKIT